MATSAPSILEKKAKKYLTCSHPSPFMVMNLQVRDEVKKEIPAVVHVDGSTRPQILIKKANPPYYRLISKFEKETGTPLVSMPKTLPWSGPPLMQ